MRLLASFLLLMLLLAAPLPAGNVQAASEGPGEYQVKAAFLYNFIKYVEWSGPQAPSATHNVNVCLIGGNPFGGALAVFEKASSASLKINVTETSDSNIGGCNIVFISKAAQSKAGQIIAATRGQPVLTSSEVSGFAEKGGMIELTMVEETLGVFSKNKVNLIINTKVANQSGLRIDAQLLEIAKTVIK